jgi:hypothetical protein
MMNSSQNDLKVLLDVAGESKEGQRKYVLPLVERLNIKLQKDISLPVLLYRVKLVLSLSVKCVVKSVL